MDQPAKLWTRLLLTLGLCFSMAQELRAENSSANSTKAAPARDRDTSADSDAATSPEPSFGHAGQFGLRAALVGGYRMILRYDESPYCREYDAAKSASDQVKFCGHGGPLGLDLGLSFAPLDSVEPFIWARFGLAGEKSTDTSPLILLGAGARIYTMSDAAFKVYVEPALGLELEGGQGHQPWARFEYKQDVVLHVAAGPSWEISQNFGVFADAGLTVGILRALQSSLELKAGLQARLP